MHFPTTLHRPAGSLAAVGIAVALLALGAGCSHAPRAPLHGWNVLLITLDTTRADRIGCYGHTGAETPRLDDLAARGTLFETAVAQGPLTLPTHASMMTGLNPPTHGVRYNAGYSLPGATETLAELLATAGYDTGAAIAAFVLERRFGLAQGFSRYDDELDEASAARGGDPRRSATEVTEAALRVAAGFREDRPYFLWAHYFDPHVPLDPPEPFRSRFPDTRAGRYDAEIARMDAAIGALLDGLRDSGQLERTLVVVVGDHGEGFLGPHDEDLHGILLYRDTLDIPFIVCAEDAVEAGRRSTALIRQIDVLPTVADLCGAAIPAGVQGESFAGYLLGKATAPADLVAYAETFVPWIRYGWSPLAKVQSGAWKYIDAPTPELYRLDDDADEGINLAARHPDRVAEMQRTLDELRSLGPGGGDAHDPMLVSSPDDINRLEMLGYVVAPHSTPENVPDTALKDPKEWVHLEVPLEWGREYFDRGDFVTAIEKLDTVLAVDPDNPEALQRKGRALVRLDRPHEAEPLFEHLVRLRPDSSQYPAELAGIEMRIAGEMYARGDSVAANRKLDEAIPHLERVVELDGESSWAPAQLGQIYMRQGNPRRAADEFRRVVEIIPDNAEANYALAAALLDTDDFLAAEAPLATVLKFADSDRGLTRRAHAALVKFYGKSRQPRRAIDSLRWLIDDAPQAPEAAAYRRMLSNVE